MIKYLILGSFIVHSIILSIKIDQDKKAKQQQQKKQQQQIVKVKIQQESKSQKQSQKQKDEDIYILNKILSDMKKIEDLAKEEAIVKSIIKDCNSFYMGIGIVHSSLYNEISYVVPGGPADIAGLKKGDTPLGKLDIRDKYKEGTQITVEVLRGSIILNIPVTIGKICTKEIENENKKPKD